MKKITKGLRIALIAIVIAVLLGQSAVLLDLYSFEYRPLLQLIGWLGIGIVIALNVGLVIIAWRSFNTLRNRPQPWRRVTNVLIGIAALAALWVLEYTFMERPLTVRLALLLRDDQPLSPAADSGSDFANFSLARQARDANAQEQLRVMYERVRINNPDVYARHPIGATIDRYAVQFGVDASLLFYLNYIDSFYGEAVSGPVPFLSSMTAETMRDMVQIHLPGWFVESGSRQALIASTGFENVFGATIGFKIRYAVHKATLDVSLQPYALNTYSDIFLVLREYPQEFADVFEGEPRDAVVAALRASFLQLKDLALMPPYEHPYRQASYGAEFYAAHRDELKRFARASTYLTMLDFDFATRLQALLSRYQRDYYSKRMSAERWRQLPAWQQASLLAMIRDLYVPNVGKVGYNLYALPEINCTPLEFAAEQAATDPALATRPDTLWRPNNPEYLWGGATYRLRVLNDVWSIAHEPIPGLGAGDSVDDARAVLWLVKGT